MPTLYYSPHACSLSPRIALLEAGMPFDSVKVDLKNKTADGKNYLQINPNGYVPALRLDDGMVITEGPVIIQWVADHAPEKKLAPAPKSAEHYKFLSWLNFITAELHKSIGMLFSPLPDEVKSGVKERLTKRLASVEDALADGRQFLLGEHFSVADGYLFWNVNAYSHLTGRELGPKLKAWFEHVGGRPKVKEALAGEV